MLDFRYHALSLVAVFLALGIGIVLGASLGDTVVSEANKDVRASLQDDVVDARAEARAAEQATAKRDAFISATFERLAGGRLDRLRDAVDGAGGTIDSVAKFDRNPDLTALGDAIGGRFRRLGTAGGPSRRLVR